MAKFTDLYTFKTYSDDGIRVWVDGQMVVDAMTDHGPRLDGDTPILLQAGQLYTIQVSYYENTGGAVARLLWQGQKHQPLEVIPRSQLYSESPPPAVVGTGTGLDVSYFNNQNLSGSAVATAVDAGVDHDWKKGSPATGVNADHFSARWEGRVQATYSGPFTFYTQSDDGVRLWVNGSLVINNWTNHGPVEDRSAPIMLEAGQFYDIKMEYFDNTGGAVARLLWSSDNQVKGAIPASQLYTSSSVTSSLTLTPSDNNIDHGDRVILTAAVATSAGSKAGTVTFYDGGQLLGSVATDTIGYAVLRAEGMGIGLHSLAAVFASDVGIPGSSAFASVEVVTPDVTIVGFTPDTGAGIADRITNSALISLFGTAGAYQQITLSATPESTETALQTWTTVADLNGQWTAMLDLSGLPESRLMFRASIETSFGVSTSKAYGIIFDATPPSLSVVGLRDEYPEGYGSFTVALADEWSLVGQPVEATLSRDGVEVTRSTAVTNFTEEASLDFGHLNPGVYTLRVTASDMAGNTKLLSQLLTIGTRTPSEAPRDTPKNGFPVNSFIDDDFFEGNMSATVRTFFFDSSFDGYKITNDGKNWTLAQKALGYTWDVPSTVTRVYRLVPSRDALNSKSAEPRFIRYYTAKESLAAATSLLAAWQNKADELVTRTNDQNLKAAEDALTAAHLQTVSLVGGLLPKFLAKGFQLAVNTAVQCYAVPSAREWVNSAQAAKELEGHMKSVTKLQERIEFLKAELAEAKRNFVPADLEWALVGIQPRSVTDRDFAKATRPKPLTDSQTFIATGASEQELNEKRAALTAEGHGVGEWILHPEKMVPAWQQAGFDVSVDNLLLYRDYKDLLPK